MLMTPQLTKKTVIKPVIGPILERPAIAPPYRDDAEP